MPGVIVRTATRSGPVNTTVPQSGRYFVSGLFQRGRTDAAQRVRSLAEVEVLYGSRVAYGSAYDDLRVYFEEGGSEAYVVRVVGPAATTGKVTLNDRTAGSSLATLEVSAVSPGAWSTGITIETTAGTMTDTYALVVRFGTDSETFNNLASPADAVSALSRSKYVRARDLGSTATGTDRLPVIAAPVALSAGADDRAAVTGVELAASLAAFGRDLGAGAVAIPGYPSWMVGAALMEHAKANRRLALLATDQGASESDALNAADELIAPDGEFGGLFYPWLEVPVSAGITKYVSPEGYVAAMRARAHRDVGPWQAPAGEIAQARFVLGPERIIDREEGDRLDAGHVSAIRTVVDSTRLYGWRSLSTDEENYALLTGRDVLNTVAVEAERRLERFVFRTIDGKGQLLGDVATELIGLVDPIRLAGGLYERTVAGQQIDPGYSVDVGPTVNTEAVINANSIAAVLAMRVSPVGTLIDLTIVKAGLTATV